MSTAIDNHHHSHTNHLSTISQTTRNLLENGTKEDVPTGSTPKKRSWDFADEWNLTKSRDILLHDWRRQGVSTSKSETFLAQHLPLPDGGQSEDEQDLATDNGLEEGEGEEDDTEQDETIKMGSPASLRSASLSSSTSSVEPNPVELSTASAQSTTSAQSTPSVQSVRSTRSKAPSVASVRSSIGGESKMPKVVTRTKSSALPTKRTLIERSTNIVGLRPKRPPVRR